MTYQNGKYLDVAEAIKTGVLVNGEYPYHKYTAAFDTIMPVTDDSLLWKTYKDIACHHPELNDFTIFDLLTEKLRSGENFHIARYNDGEWVFMLKIEPYYSKFIENHGHNVDEVASISRKLLNIIDAEPDYYIGIDSTTRALQGVIAHAREPFEAKLKKIPYLLYGDIFNAATIRFGIKCLLEPLEDRFTISVGPSYMQALRANHHIAVPTNNCWNKSQEVETTLHQLIKKNQQQHPVILYSCSLLAKLLLDNCYKQYGNSITQLDIGSCIDPWCGMASRPWHRILARHYKLHVIDYGVTLT